jgi:hypothetical protein
VALVAKRNQIIGVIMPQAAPRLFVMDLKVATHAADLTSPAIPHEDLIAEPSVRFSFEP